MNSVGLGVDVSTHVKTHCLSLPMGYVFLKMTSPIGFFLWAMGSIHEVYSPKSIQDITIQYVKIYEK